jgi:hypothetical protein
MYPCTCNACIHAYMHVSEHQDDDHSSTYARPIDLDTVTSSVTVTVTRDP